MKVLKTHKNFSGMIRFWEHDSAVTKTKMKFSTFTPEGEVKCALVWLSGLTCTDENFITKAGAQKYLAEAGMMVICPDTSPRGLSLPHEHDSYDFGSGAGFYLNATTLGYQDHYRMYDYVVQEIYGILEKDFKIKKNIAISGHSMGGHGALVIGLREGEKFKSVSAFSPITHPAKVPWGEKAFMGYLGADYSAWAAYDACELIRSGHQHSKIILIDQGTADEFIEKQLTPEVFQQACAQTGKQDLKLRLQAGYDHSYYFIATFIEDHVRFHANNMGLG